MNTSYSMKENPCWSTLIISTFQTFNGPVWCCNSMTAWNRYGVHDSLIYILLHTRVLTLVYWQRFGPMAGSIHVFSTLGLAEWIRNIPAFTKMTARTSAYTFVFDASSSSYSGICEPLLFAFRDAVFPWPVLLSGKGSWFKARITETPDIRSFCGVELKIISSSGS